LAAYHRADVTFHETLALASGNRMLASMLEALGECLHTSVESAGQGHFARGGTTAEVVAAQRRILDTVRAGDARLARSAMQQHLRQAERDLHVALGPLATAPAANETGAPTTPPVPHLPQET
jgi:GntR family transcriptional repressor for pyruvate dehydrogenase complex